MSSCTLPETFKKDVDTFIGAYESELEEGNLNAAEKADIEDALNQLYAYQKALSEKDSEFIRAQGKAHEYDEEQQALLTASFKEVLGTEFTFTKGTARKEHKATLLEVKPSANGGTLVTMIPHAGGDPKAYTFSASSKGRSDLQPDGTSIVLPEFSSFTDDYHSKVFSAELDGYVLGSTSDTFTLGTEHRQADYTHGDIDHMKAMLRRLHLLGGDKASDQDLDLYLSYIDKMKPSFFNKLALYIEEEADQSKGSASPSRIDLKVSNTPRLISTQQSEASIYLEEVIHSMTAAALRGKTPEAGKLQRRLRNLQDTAQKHVKWEDFLPDIEVNKEAEEAYAKSIYDYIFSSKNNEDEFLAKAIAVPEVAAILKKLKVTESGTKRGFWTKVNDMFAFIVDVLQGNLTATGRKESVHEAIVNLAYEMGEINKKAHNNIKKKGGWLDAVFGILNYLDDKVEAATSNFKDTHLDRHMTKPLGEVPDSLYGKVKYYAQLITLSIVNPVFTKAMGAIFSSVGLKPTSSIRELVGGMFASDSVQKVAEFLIMQSGYIDKRRNMQMDLVRANTLHKFKDHRAITAEQEEAATLVLVDTDLTHLFGKTSTTQRHGLNSLVYDNKTLRNMLTDEQALKTQITAVKKALRGLDGTHYYWHMNQAVGLGYYLATHRAAKGQNMNSLNIAKGLLSNHKKRPNTKVMAAIDELATLVALKNTNAASKASIAELMRTDWVGVNHVADVYEGMKKNSEQLFGKQKTNMIKGYSREVFDDTIIKEVAPIADKEFMKSQGFTLQSELGSYGALSNHKPMGLYVTDKNTRPERLRGSVRLNQITSRGETITSSAYKSGKGFDNALIHERARHDINRLESEARVEAKKMEAGNYDFSKASYGIAPVLNDSGRVVDYRYMMDKETKKRLLGQDTRISEVMGRSFGTITDKVLSKEHNEKALDAIKKDMAESWSGGDKGLDAMTDYTLIGPDVGDPEMRKLYYMLPNSYRKFIKGREDKVMAVRTDLMHIYFGYSHMSILDLIPYANKLTPTVIKKFIHLAERLWMDIVKIAKANILIKMPIVLASNILSNLLYAILKGYNPVTVLKMYSESYRQISEYNKTLKEHQELQNKVFELRSGLNSDILSSSRRSALQREIKLTTTRLRALKKRMDASPIKELTDMGLDQNVEDVTNDVEHDSNRIVQFFDEKLNKMPEIVRTGVDFAFITKRTKYYQVANQFLEISDLIARDVQNKLDKEVAEQQKNGKRKLPRWWLDRQEGEYLDTQLLTGEERKLFETLEEEHRRYELVEDFINYAKPSGRFEEYLNKVGILMFTKYVKRIQRIIAKNSATSPIKTLLGIMTFGFLGGYPSIHEQSFLSKDWYTESVGPGNVFPIYSPTDILYNFMTPSILKASTYGMDGW